MYAFQVFTDVAVLRKHIVVLVAVGVLHAGGGVVHVLILRTEGDAGADGAACTEVELPWGGEFVLVLHVTVPSVVAVDGGLVGVDVVTVDHVVLRGQSGGVAFGEGVPGGGVDGQADAEGVVLEGTEDGSHLEVYAGAVGLVPVLQGVAGIQLVAAVLPQEVFAIDRVAGVVDIVGTDGGTEVEAVLHVEGHVEVVDAGASLGLAAVAGIVTVPSVEVVHGLSTLGSLHGIHQAGAASHDGEPSEFLVLEGTDIAAGDHVGETVVGSAIPRS